MDDLSVESLSFAYERSAQLFDDLSCTFRAAEITALIGPNGCGKSTLLKLLAGVLRPTAGAVRLGADDVRSLAPRARAQRIGLLFQENSAAGDLTVRDLVIEGRYPHLGFLASPRATDRAAVDRALSICHLAELAERPLATLSSGQRRLAFIAMAVAQGTPWLLLDEPTSYLDVARELDVWRIVHQLRDDLGVSVILSVHDLNAAAAGADQICAFKSGSLVQAGSPSDVLTAETLLSVYGARATILRHPKSGCPVILWEGA